MASFTSSIGTAIYQVLFVVIDIIDYVTGIGNSSREQYKRTGNPCRYHGAGMVGVLKTGLDWTPTHGQYWTHGLKFGQSMATFAVIQDEKETNKLVVAYSEVLVGIIKD